MSLKSQHVWFAIGLLALGVRLVCAQTQKDAPHSGVTLSGVVLGSVQPTDSTYVGGPGSTYLDRGLGGVGPGIGLRLDLPAGPMSISVEFSTT